MAPPLIPVGDGLAGYPPGLSVSGYDPSTGMLSITGDADPSVYQELIQALKYDNLSTRPDETNREIQILVTDQSGDTAMATSTVTVTELNNAPQLDLDTTMAGVDATAVFVGLGYPF